LATDEQLTAWVSSLNMDVDPRALGAAGGERLRALRTVIRDLALAAIDGRPLDRRLVAELNAVAAAAPMTSQLGVTKASPRLRTAHAPATPPLDALLGDLARSAIELLAGDERALLRACPGEGCRLLFVATDPRRVWCSSETCGNRARVARHRAERR
jgi:predicted RNA-binding Zn ribbon-like protein